MTISQCNKIVNHIKTNGSITAQEAMEQYGIFRLAARISDIKKMGYPVLTIMEQGKNRYDEPTRYARYIIEEDN